MVRYSVTEKVTPEVTLGLAEEVTNVLTFPSIDRLRVMLKNRSV